MNREQLIEQARTQYASDDLEIDDNAQVNPTADGTGHWVQAWVYINTTDDQENLHIELDNISHINE